MESFRTRLKVILPVCKKSYLSTNSHEKLTKSGKSVKLVSVRTLLKITSLDSVATPQGNDISLSLYIYMYIVLNIQTGCHVCCIYVGNCRSYLPYQIWLSFGHYFRSLSIICLIEWSAFVTNASLYIEGSCLFSKWRGRVREEQNHYWMATELFMTIDILPNIGKIWVHLECFRFIKWSA